MLKKRVTLILLGCLILGFVACDNDHKDELGSVHIVLTLTGPRYQGDFYASFLQVTTDYAFWIEDAQRNFIKTLQITPVAVTVDSAVGSHIEHLPSWSQSAGLTYSDLESETLDGLPPSFDGLTSASPFFSSETDADTLTVCWDLTDADGQKVTSGIYYACVEAANIIKEGDSDAGTVTRFEINAETLSMQIDLDEETFNTDDPTANLTGMTTDFLDEGN